MIYVKFDTQSPTGLQTWIDKLSEIIHVNISIFDPQFTPVVTTGKADAEKQATEWRAIHRRSTSHYPNIRLLADNTAEVIGEVVSEFYSSAIAYVVVSRFYFDANANPHVKQMRNGLPVFDELLAKDTLTLISFGVQACLRDFVALPDDFPKQLDGFVASNLKGKITLTSASRALDIPANSLRVYLEREFHCNLNNYVKAKKIDAAKLLLETTDLPLCAIAEQIGLEKESWENLFKKQVALPPEEYRAKFRK